jgi:hypothetical protein
MTAREKAAAFILAEAAALGMAVGTNGEELVMRAPLRVSFTVRRIFEDALENYRAEVIAHILREGRA